MQATHYDIAFLLSVGQGSSFLYTWAPHLLDLFFSFGLHLHPPLTSSRSVLCMYIYIYIYVVACFSPSPVIPSIGITVRDLVQGGCDCRGLNI